MSGFVELQPESRGGGGDGHLALVENQQDLHLVPWPFEVMVKMDCDS